MQGRQKRSPSAFLSLALTFLWFICFSSLIHANDQVNALWIAVSSGVIKVATADGSVLLEIEDAGDTSAVAVDQQRTLLWVYGNGTLRAYGFDGVLHTQTQVSSISDGEEHSACRDDVSSYDDEDDSETSCDDQDEFEGELKPVDLVIDDNDGSLWLGVHKTLYHFDQTGTHLGSTTFDHVIRAISHETSLNRLWVALANTVLITTIDGATVEFIELNQSDKVIDLVYDDALDQLWVVTKKQLQRYAANGELSYQQPFKHLQIAAPDGMGGVWLAAKHKLYRMDVSGLIHFEMRPFHGEGSGRIIDIVADQTDHTAWVASKHAVKHIDSDGQILHTVEMEQGEGVPRIKIRDLAIYFDAVAPELTILSPADTSYINSQQPQISLELVDDGSGVDVDSLEILADGETLPVECSGTLPEWVCTPTVALAEGTVILSVTVADNAGNRSEPAETTFTIDTQQPEITLQSPVDGLLTNHPELTASGSVSEAVMVTLNGEPLTLSIDHTFSETLTLVEGDNAVDLQARDLAGNTTDLSVLVVLDTLPPPPVDLGLIHVSDVVDGKVTVTGDPASVEPGANVTITNRRTGETVTITANADGSFILLITAEHSDEMSIFVTDQADNDSDEAGTAVTDVVPGVGTIPPDPAQLAPPLSPSAPVTLYAASEFLYSGSPPVQTGVDPATISKQRVAVVRGLVLDRNNRPLPGVKITIKNHVEFGQTLTRRDGMLDMAVNGGGLLTINYEKAGYLPVQRKVDAPWQDYIWADDVVMIRLDEEVSTINLGNPAALMQIAQGSPVTDEDGTRQATVLFPTGTTATMIMPDGTTQSLTTLNVRATEYTVGENGPEAMPSPLPPASAYTYAVELSADEVIAAGAKRVEFNQVLPLYVDNFLNFPVGVIVPVGFYDFDKTAWVPSDNGRVIQILRIESGRAILDVMGNGQAATVGELSTLGVTDQELVMLAGLYEAGKMLWRAPVTHFTPWDYNWPYGPPDDADPPEPPPPPPENDVDDPEEPECEENSIIECQSQVLGERLSITGTPYTLNYRSNRVPGRLNSNTSIASINLTEENVPASLRSIELRISIAGKLIRQKFLPRPNLTYDLDWNGEDAYGRALVGIFPASMKIIYQYDAVYYGSSSQFRDNWNRIFNRWISEYGQTGVADIGAGRRGSASVGLERGWNANIPISALGGADVPYDAQKLGMGGWCLDIQHNYDPLSKTLNIGSGSTISANNLGYTIRAYSSTIDSTGKGAVDAEGNIYLAQQSEHRVIKISPSGVHTVVAGNGVQGFSGDGGPALSARLSAPADVSLGPNGEIYIADLANHRIRTVNRDGNIQTVAGNGTRGFGGDEGPAVEASLNYPKSVVATSDGTLYIADSSNHRVRRVSTDGRISTYAGNGELGFGGDGGAATQASFWGMNELSIDSEGNLYIVDTMDHRVRKIGGQGIITTVAGNGSRGYSGDGGLSIYAELDQPSSLAVSDTGGLYITDTGNRRVRYIDPTSGNISTVAGTGEYGDTGDLAPATKATFRSLVDILLSNDGKLYIVDIHRVRMMGLTMEGYTGEGHLVPSRVGDELYVFDHEGRHLRTVSTITGTDIHSFSYEDNGFINRVTDGYGNVTEIERNLDGSISAIISPDNHRTDIELNNNGYLTNLTNPNSESYLFEYSTDGLLTSMTDPKGHRSIISYNDEGRLVSDQNPAGGAFSISRTNLDDGYSVELVSSSGKTTRYDVALGAGLETRTKTRPDGTTQRRIIDSAGSWAREETISSDGLTSIIDYSSDQRFGWLARHQGNTSMETPSGITSQTETRDVVALNDVTNPLSLISTTNHYTVNGRNSSVHYDAATLSYNYTSPQQRQRTKIVNPQGGLLSDQYADLATVHYDYDARGRLVALRMGEDADERRLSVDYGQDGQVSTLIDPLRRVFSFSYDPVGRVTEQMLPDGRVIGYQYDEKGNLTAVVPPGRNAHVFEFTPIDLEASYTPPDVGAGTNITRYGYNLDKQLTTVERPDGITISLDYDTGGRLSIVTLPRGFFQYGYNDQTGLLDSVLDPASGMLSFTYDGPLFVGETWSGEIMGTVERQYDNNFWITGYSVNGDTVAMVYDQDGLLTQSGELTLVRDDANGLITATHQAEINSVTAYNVFGEKERERFTTTSSVLDAVVEGQGISADTLQIAGHIGGVGAVVINGQTMQVTSDGVITGEVSLPSINTNNLDINVYDPVGLLVGQLQRTVVREPSQTDFNINSIVEMAPNGDIYFFNETTAGQELLRRPAGSSTASQPIWLNGATDVTVAANGEIYLLKGMNLTRYDGNAESTVLDLAIAGLVTASDIEMGLDGRVYVASERNIHSIEGGSLALVSTLPGGSQTVSLEHSAWGLVANAGVGDYFYRIQPDGALETLRRSETWNSSDFALSDGGTVCWRDEGPVCTLINDPSTPWDWQQFFADSMEFGPDGALYYGDLDNIYRHYSGINEPILSGGQTVSGTLRLSGSLGDSLFGVGYSRDKLGRITEKTDTVEGVATTTVYGYDLAGRLQSVIEDGVEIARYQYDSNGNRTHVNGTLIATYDEQDRLLTYGDTAYSYMANGELAEKTENGVITHFTYDVLGNLMQVRLPGDVIIDYVIDGKNRRIGKKVNGELVQGFLFKDQLNPIVELDNDGNITSHFVYGSKINVPAYMVKDGVSYRVVSDHLGSPRLIVNTLTGEVAQRVDYDSWGNVILDTNPGFQPFGFAGGIYDYHTQLMRFGARDYDPEIARWMAKDPIGFDGDGVNIFTYAGSDPVNFIDLLGFGKFRSIKDALRRVHRELDGSLPKGKTGKYGSPQRGDSKKGYRYDREGHPNSNDPNEQGPHINYWDYTKGKRGKGGKSGAIPLSGAGADIFGEGSLGADITDFFNPMSDIQDLKDMISDWNSPDKVDSETYEAFCRQNPTAPNCTDMNICP